MRIEDHARPHHDSCPSYEIGLLDRVHVQYESLSRRHSDSIVETQQRGDFVEVPCKLAPAIRRRRLVA